MIWCCGYFVLDLDKQKYDLNSETETETELNPETKHKQYFMVCTIEKNTSCYWKRYYVMIMLKDN